MRKILYIKTALLFKALIGLGYKKISFHHSFSEWRCGSFHLFVKEKKDKIILKLHKDLPSIYPPYHRSKSKGIELKREMSRIVKASKEMLKRNF